MESVERFVGKVFDKRYIIERVIGVGGMSVVFEAQDVVMNRKVAVKILKDEFAGDEQAVNRFVDEATAISMLSHPNIVRIFDISVKNQLKYIVMERVEGITLKSYMQKKGALSQEETLSYAEQVLSALDHAHSKSIIHRDIKPQNILLLRNGKVKLTDFGIAMLPNAAPSHLEKKAVGTVYYISPEQAGGKGIDRRSDLYSLGIVMYEMATGVLPFNADTAVSVAMKQINEKPTPPSEVNRSVSKGLEQIILGAMEKAPERRFQTADQMRKYVSKLRMNPEYIFKVRSEAQNAEHGIGAIVNKNMRLKNDKNKENNKSKLQSRSMFPIILGVTVAFLIVFIISGITVFSKVLKKQSDTASEPIEIPSIVGKLYDGSLDDILDPSFYDVKIEWQYSSTVPENQIIGQTPSGGSKRRVKKDVQKCTITVTVSKGIERVVVPDYTVWDYRQAEIDAYNKGFNYEIIMITSDTVDAGFVVYTEPAALTEVEYGSTLKIYYSKGNTGKKVLVPVLTGLTSKQAYAKMGGNFKVGEVTYEYSETVPANIIIYQSIPSNTEAIKGTRINFVISKGPDPALQPDTTDPSIDTDPPEIFGGE